MHKVSPDLQWRFAIQLDNVLQWPRLVTACVRIQCEQRKYLIVSLIFAELQKIPNTICSQNASNHAKGKGAISCDITSAKR